MSEPNDARPAQAPGDSRLLRSASRSMFWNATLLPAVMLFQLAANMVLRRTFGLDSGIYDAGIGLVNGLLVYGSLGLAVAIPQFVPQLTQRGGRNAVIHFLRRAWSARMAVLVAVLVPVNLLAEPIADTMSLGPDGLLLVRLVSGLALLRAVVDLAVRTLQAQLAHLTANIVRALQTVGAALAILAALWMGSDMSGVFVALVVVGAGVGAVAVVAALRSVSRLEAETDDSASEVPSGRFWKFASFMYAYDMLQTLSMPAFAAPALAAVVATVGPVALFTTAFQIPMMIVVVILAGFQGLYRPLFAIVLTENDRDRLRTTFTEVTKVQLILLLPAGAGLLVVLGDLIPLLFGPVFTAAVPLARILCAFLFAESILNLGVIILSTDHRYRSVLGAQSIRVLTAPLFLLLAGTGHLTAATWCFAAGRLAAIVGAYWIARGRYQLRLPWGFAARVALPATVMTAVALLLWGILPPGWTRVLTVSAVGAFLFALLARWARIIGPREADLLRRASFPGRQALLRWLAPTP